MILAIDMGNTNIVLGGIDEKQTYFIERVTTDQGRTDTEYAIHFKNILEMHHIQLSDIEGAILSSVVPAFKHYDLKCRRKGSRHPPSVSWLRYENRHEHPYGQP